jgi:hypothetical protein
MPYFLRDYWKVITCTADLTPRSSPSLGEGSSITIVNYTSKVMTKGNTIAIKAEASSPYEGEGWGGVGQN